MPIVRNFSLVKGGEPPEQRTLPRFPYCFLTFKSNNSECERAFEVKDISYTGMQLALKDGGHNFKEKGVIDGQLHWLGNVLKVEGSVKWTTSSRVGIAFNTGDKFQKEVSDFLSIQNIVAGLKPIHSLGLDIEIPANLQFWLRADGPCEVFIWQHNDTEISRFQIIIFENFVEWEDGKGLRTGRVLTKRDIDLPLLAEDCFVFQADGVLGQERLERACALMGHLDRSMLSQKAYDFLMMKLNH